MSVAERKYTNRDKLIAFCTMVLAGAEYKSRRRDVSFWHWLYERVSDSDDKKNGNYWLAQFLLADAINKNDGKKLAKVMANLWQAARIDESKTKHLYDMRALAHRSGLEEERRWIEKVLALRGNDEGSSGSGSSGSGSSGSE